MWLAAWVVDRDRREPFSAYALLGDDIVIADKRVAKRYRELVELIGVQISASKSLESNIGGFEFAKQFWIKTKNLSPVSAKALLSMYNFLGLVQIADKYECSTSCLIRLAGGGYRVRSRILSSKIYHRWKRLRVISERQKCWALLPVEWWFGRENRLNPYLKGTIVAWRLERLKPKDLELIPDQYLEYPD